MQRNMTFYLRYILLAIICTGAFSLQGQWNHLLGPFGGYVRQFDTDGTLLYALTYGGIYKSPDEGETWLLLEHTLTSAPEIAEFQVEKGLIYILNYEGSVFRSNNEGGSWSPVFQRPYPNDGPGEKLQKLFASGDTLLIGSVLSIYRSLDQGQSWQSSEVFFKQKVIEFSKIGNDLYAAFDWFIQKSVDGGLSWKTVFTSSYFFGAMTAVDSVLYAIYDGYPRVIRSKNGGSSWDKFDSDSIWVGQYYRDFPDWLTGVGDQLYYVANYGCFHGGTLVHRSADYGEHWSAPPLHGIQENWTTDALAYPNQLLFATGQGVLRSNDGGGAYVTSHRGMHATNVRKIFKTAASHWWAATQSGIFSSADGGTTWTLQHLAELKNPCSWNNLNHFGQTRQRVIVQDCAALYLSDNGVSWDTLVPASPLFCLDVTTGDDAVYILTTDSLFRLDDGQSNPVPIKRPDSLGAFSGRIFYGAGMVFISEWDKTWYSKDKGQNWSFFPVFTENGQEYPDGSWIDADTTNVYLDIDNPDGIDFIGKWASLDNTWKRIYIIDAESGDTIEPSSIRPLWNTGPVRWMGVSGRGLCYSIDSDDSWQIHAYNPPIPATFPSALHIAGEEMWVGTTGAGIFKTNFKLKTSENSSIHFTLYPNPSNGETLQLKSDLFLPEEIQFRIFDTAGRILNELTLPAGQQWSFDFSALPAGIYLIYVQTGAARSTLKWVKKG